MSMIVRLPVALVLLAIAVFCVFGFLATLEPPGSIGLRVVYAAVGLAALSGAGWLVFARARQG